LKRRRILPILLKRFARLSLNSATFKAYIPPDPRHQNVKSKENKNILVVDDNEQALTLVKEALVTRGFNVSTYNRGMEAMAALESKKGDVIDLVIIDLVMPDVDGMELAGKILTKRPEIKILVMSGYADDVVVHGIFEKKSVDFLGKPFSIRDLFTKVSVLLAQGT
jgi:two-component system, cell cycle sensor histidine kinase and response regulator CckA